MVRKPLLIVLTPVYNEAWILNAFLKATSLWADHIIIADQMSTDGSRDIYLQYEKVVVVDNPCKEMHQARARQLLFDAVKKIKGDKILFALDADEFLSGDFVNTIGWNTIINSKIGDVFYFRWKNLLPEYSKYITSQPFYWVAHLSDEDILGFFPDNSIHEWRLPWPKTCNKEYFIDDISFIHFARVNVIRNDNKSIFYQVFTAYKDKNYSGVKLYRQYHTYQQVNPSNYAELPMDTYSYYQNHNLNLFNEIQLNALGQHYLDECKKFFSIKGIKYFSKLNIWNSDFVQEYGLKNPQSLLDKLMMYYLSSTKKWASTFIVKSIDYVLKKIY